MRFVVAIVAFVLAAAAIGLGVAQRTVLAGPSSISSTVTTGDAPLTVVDAETLNANAGIQGIEVEVEGDIVLAYGRTADVLAWVGDSSYNEVGWDADEGELTTRVVSGTEPAAEVPSPAGSDLWLREFTGTDVLTRRINAPEGISVIIAAAPPAAAPVEGETAEPVEGETAATGALSTLPIDLTITWPLETTSPTSGPLVIAGIVLLLAGLAAFIWALIHARSRRGPRRNVPKQPKQPKLPKPPKPPQLKPAKKGDAAGPAELEAPGSRRRTPRRRAFLAAGLATAGALALAGCTVPSELPAPDPSPTVAGTTPPVVTQGQFEAILVEAATTVADADAAANADLAGQRLTGAALALRLANYTIRAADSTYGPLAPIPDELFPVVLPQQSESWPRAVFAVTRAEGVAGVGLLLTQEAPRENYKIAYATTLISGVPDVAPPELGAPFQTPSNNLGILPPEELATAYGDILIKGDQSEFFDMFQAEEDSLREQIGIDQKTQRQTDLGSSATIAFSSAASGDPVFAFTTNDNGQIVAAGLHDIETVTPVEAGAAINPSGQVKALSGKAQSTRGIVATYGVQLLFYVPPVSQTDGKIVLLGYAQGLVAAAEVP